MKFLNSTSLFSFTVEKLLPHLKICLKITTENIFELVFNYEFNINDCTNYR